MKIMIIGDRRAGKTNFFHQLKQVVTENNKKKKKNILNRGKKKKVVVHSMDQLLTPQPYDIHSLVLSTRNDVEIGLSVWDFVGNRSYWPLYPLYFSDCAVYIIVWNLLSPTSLFCVRNWLYLVRSRVPRAAIVLVGTHADLDKVSLKIQLDIARSTYQNVFPNIKGIFTTGLDSYSKSINEIIKVIEDTSMKEKETYLDNYFSLEAQLNNRPRDKAPILTWEQFSKDCAFFTQEDNQIELAVKAADFLHLVGSLYVIPPPKQTKSRAKTRNFVPKKIIVADPLWIANLYTLLFTAERRGLIKKGRLRTSDLHDNIWNDQSVALPKNLFDTFLTFFQESELVYPLPSTAGQELLFPPALSSTKPFIQGKWDAINDVPHLQYSRIYKFQDSVPLGLLNRVIQNFIHLELTYWSTGILLSFDNCNFNDEHEKNEKNTSSAEDVNRHLLKKRTKV